MRLIGKCRRTADIKWKENLTNKRRGCVDA